MKIEEVIQSATEEYMGTLADVLEFKLSEETEDTQKAVVTLSQKLVKLERVTVTKAQIAEHFLEDEKDILAAVSVIIKASEDPNGNDYLLQTLEDACSNFNEVHRRSGLNHSREDSVDSEESELDSVDNDNVGRSRSTSLSDSRLFGGSSHKLPKGRPESNQPTSETRARSASHSR